MKYFLLLICFLNSGCYSDSNKSHLEIIQEATKQSLSYHQSQDKKLDMILSALQDPEPTPEVCESTNVETEEPVPYETFDLKPPVYSVRHDNLSWSAVALGNKTFLTAGHPSRNRLNVEVMINNEWIKGIYTPKSQYGDFAIITLNTDVDITECTVGNFDYMEDVYVYGDTSKQIMYGKITNKQTNTKNTNAELGLDFESIGITQGDSGGGVFNLKNELVGILTYHNSFDRRVVGFTKIPNEYKQKEFADSGDKPIVYITYADFFCPPCEILKKAISDGKYSDFDVQEIKIRNGIPSFPFVEYINKNGERRYIIPQKINNFWTEYVPNYINKNAK